MPSRKSEPTYRNPAPTVDLIIQIKTPRGDDGIILIKRKYPPPGWALPGGFVDYGESLEQAAVREAEEETSLKVRLLGQLHTYSDPGRDPRRHTITTVFIARARGVPVARDDAGDIGIFTRREINFPLAFDHRRILDDYYRFIRKTKGRDFAAEVAPRAKPGAPAAADRTPKNPKTRGGRRHGRTQSS
jgi:ADP-ribose pyrophosphatase YjhB (NUDIX family)